MISVYLAIPNRGTNNSTLTQHLIYWYLRANVIGVTFNMPPNMLVLRPLDASRNQIVKDFLQSQAEILWWIDDDIIPPLGAFERMMGTLRGNDNIDALGAVCFSMREEAGDYAPYPVTLRKNEEQKLKIHYGKGLDWVDAVGGACVMVRRRVYESLTRPYEYHYREDGTRSFDCDFDIWEKAKGRGHALFVDFDILCDHQRVCSILKIQNLLAKKFNSFREEVDNGE